MSMLKLVKMYIKLKSTHLSSNLKQKLLLFFYFKYARIMSTLYVYNYATELLASIIQTYRLIESVWMIETTELFIIVLCSTRFYH